MSRASVTPGLVATDLDGTLLRSDKSVSDLTQRVLAAVDEAGIPVVFVTGRPIRWMEHLWPLVGRHGAAILSNGAILYDVPGRRVRRLAGLERAAGLAVADAVLAAVPDAQLAIETSRGIRAEPAYDHPDVPAGSPIGPLADVWDEPAAKLLVREPSLDVEALRARVVAAVGDLAVVTWSGLALVEISAPGVTKAAALAALCEELGVPAERVVAFGDGANDVAMLEWAGTSYAMGDADPEALAAADHLGPSSDEDGVARVLARLVRGLADLL